MSGVPIVVDLDGTLVRSDLLHEAATAYVTSRPTNMFQLLAWLRGGRASFKHEIAGSVPVDPGVVPYNDALVAWLRQQKHDGRRLVLASASPESWVRAIADDLRIFDDVVATQGAVNLKGPAKRDALVQMFGPGGYEYVGNHEDDLVVWGAASTAHVAGPKTHLVQKLPASVEVGKVFANRRNHPLDVLRAMRPHQWAKNLLVFIPLLTAQLVGQPAQVISAGIAFICFCLAASSVYLLNDLADIPNDRLHPSKAARPFASGRLGVGVGWFLAPLMAVTSIAAAGLLVSIDLMVVVVAYLLLTTAYSFGLKRVAVVDVIALAGLYTIRIVAGAAAVHAPLSMWLLTFSLFLFLSLALVKRVSEVARLQREGGAPTDSLSGRGYQVADMEMLSSLGVGSGIASTIVMSLYVSDPVTSVLYESPNILWASVPILLFWIMRVWMLAHRGQMNEDPVVFAVRDRASLFAGAMLGTVFLIAKLAW